MIACERILVLLLAAVLLTGCGLWSRDTSEPPAPLPDFEATLEPQGLWSRNTGAGSDGQYLQLSPFLGPESVVAVDARGRVSAHALDDGDRLWQVDLNEPITAGVSGGGDRVIVGTGKGHAIALSLETGDELWRRTLTSEVQGISRVDQGAVVFRTNDGRLHALDARTGETGWTAGRTTPALSLRGTGAPLMFSGRVAAGFDNGRVVMLGLGRGNVLWEATVSTPSGRSELERMADVDGALAVEDGVLYAAGYQGRVMALALSDGRVLWQRDLSSYRGVSVAGQMLFLTDSEGHVWALDRRNGATLWQQDRLRLRRVTLPVVLGEHLVVGDYEGYLHWISPEDGALVGRARGDHQGIMGVPQVRDGVMYTLGRGGRLSAFTLPSEN
ncbi:outer membrane protein assembly factor BamB [Ectothiorhodospira marina]|uniref:Outer membrane protein assembly factor BamB n=1 Tax=Ectothiorhodospira marina TaxID=1396821 RepID=A0A1H7FQF0_9GAMM|nr:outer membrane protein assembly factor BamB [Ectothiorhodospira marina]SEK26692.1 outer membrane protein assembly factor BamB [Ectothiorhodospira marina]